jgi:hypothetical protein
VRIWIPLSLLLLAGGLMRARGGTETTRPVRASAPVAPSRSPEVKEEPDVIHEEPPRPGAVPAKPPAPELRREGGGVEVSMRESTRRESAVPSPLLLARLQRELVLDPTQSSYLVRVLREREQEIRECHERHRRMGVLDLREYEWWVSEHKGLWFRRIDAMLDPSQHARWVELAKENVLGDGLEFEVSEGMAILE